jgi:PPOX class probable F420-dependent enzyme
MPKIEPKVADFITRRRVARLATSDAAGVPHVVPVCYAFDGERVYTALDMKPKRVEALRLKRVRNIAENPAVALVIDDYSEDWSALAYVLIRGNAALLDSGAEREIAESMLRAKYPQYQRMLPHGAPVLRVTVESVVSWGAV